MGTVFTPVRGIESEILKSKPIDGYVWFATDTKKIYYSNGIEFLSMGGNSSIFYGILDTSQTDSAQTEYIFTIDDLEPTETSLTIPQINDLILNRDGCFYRVTSLDYEQGEVEIYTNKLTLAGGGGNGSGSGSGTSGQANVSYIMPSQLEATTSYSVLYGQKCLISFGIISKDSAGDDTVGGEVIWTKNSLEVGRSKVYPGINTIDISQFLSEGSQKIQGIFSLDTGGEYPTVLRKSWTINAINIQLKWDYDIKTIQKNSFLSLNFTGYGGDGDITKTAHIIIDNALEVEPYSFQNNREINYTINRTQYGLTHGVHLISMYISAIVNGTEFKTDTISYKMLFVDQEEKDVVILIGLENSNMLQYNTLSVPIIVYNPKNDESTITLRENGVELDKIVVQNGVQFNWNYTPMTYGENILSVASEGQDSNLIIQVEKLDIDNDLEDKNYAFSLKANSFASNNQLKNWNSNGVTAKFSDNFDWVNGGMKSEADEEENERKFICVKAGTSMEINYKLFEQFYGTGKNIKIIFKATNCSNYNANVISCVSSDGSSQVGLRLQAQSAIYSTSASTVVTDYCEDTYIEYELDINPTTHYIMPWLDGVPVGIKTYSNDIITQDANKTVNITIGSQDCDVYLYLFKVYEKHLTDDQHLNNFIADAYNAQEMLKRYKRNDILNSNHEIDYNKLIQANPNCQVHLYEIPRLPMGKDSAGNSDKVTVDKYFLYQTDNTKPLMYSGKSFGKDCSIKVQGTSSAAYGVAAFNIDTDFKKGMFDSDGQEISVYYLDGEEKSIGEKYFNTKVNVASCEGANNAINAEWYNHFQPYISLSRRKKSEDDTISEKRRDTMQFKPGIMFIMDKNEHTSNDTKFIENQEIDNAFKDTNNGNYVKSPYYKMYAVCNFGNSKKNANTLHDLQNAKEICIEITDNNKKGQWMTWAAGYDESTQTYVDLTDKSLLDDDGQTNEYYEKWYNNMSDNDYDVRYVNGTDGVASATQEQILQFFRLVQWMAKNDPNEYSDSHPHGYTNEKFTKDTEGAVKNSKTGEYEVTFGSYVFKDKDWTGSKDTVLGGLKIENYAGTYTADTYKYRMAKLLSECEDYLIMDSIIFHYLFIERHTMIDNVAKNTFWTTEDGLHWNLVKDYDNDTADGNDNSGHLTLTYGYEGMDKVSSKTDGTQSYVFNAHESVWFNFIDGLEAARRKMYQHLDLQGAWSAKNYLKDFEKWQNSIPERCWIEDYYRKYIRPYEVYSDSTYLDMLEGGKKTHQRRQYETYQEIYLATKYRSSAIYNKNNSIYIRGNAKYLDGTKPVIPVKMYADCYLVTEWAQEVQSQRVKRNTVVNIVAPHSNMNDETIYWFAPNTYSSIGDVGVLAPKVLSLSGASRLSDFTIGETSKVADLGAIEFKGNKLLKHLSVKNCTGLGGTVDVLDENGDVSTQLNGLALDLSDLTSLQTLNTEGSVFTEITLPNNAPLSSVKLNDIKALFANNLYQLNELTLENYHNLNTLIFDNIDNNKFNSLNDLIFKCDNLNHYQFKNINWKIDDAKQINEDDYKIAILEEILTYDPKGYNYNNHEWINSNHANSLTGNLLIGSKAYNGTDGLLFYNNYIVEDKFANLNINFENKDSTLYDVKIVNGDGTVVWSKKAPANTVLDAEFFQDGPNGAFDPEAIIKSSTMQFNYHFKNQWWVNKDNILDSGLPYQDENNILLNEDIVFTPIFDSTIRQYKVQFKLADGTLINTDNQMFDYDTPLKNIWPKEMPNKPDTDLEQDETYAFMGYALSPNAAEALNLDNYLVRSEQTFYAIFVRKKVWENVLSDKYLNFEMDKYIPQFGPNAGREVVGYYIYPKSQDEVILTGKITFPSTYMNKPVLGLRIKNQNNTFGTQKITHIFWEKEHREIYNIDDYSIAIAATIGETFNHSLVYCELPDTIERVGKYALQEQRLLEISDLPLNLYTIEEGAFRALASATISYIGNKITTIGNRAFAGITMGKTSFLIFGNSIKHLGQGVIQGYAWNDGMLPSKMQNKSRLTAIYIGSGIQSIGSEAFKSQNSNEADINTVRNIYLDINSSDITGSPWDAGENVTIHWNTPIPQNLMEGISNEED